MTYPNIPARRHFLRQTASLAAALPALAALAAWACAIDIRLPGVPLAELHQAALSLNAGGVGFYPRDQFVHLDTGRVRNW